MGGWDIRDLKCCLLSELTPPITESRRINMTTPNDADRDFGSSDCSSAFEIIPRLLDIGYKIRKQDGEWWIFEDNGEGVVGGATFREMCERLVGVDVKEHERRYAERCRWYVENRDRLLGRK